MDDYYVGGPSHNGKRGRGTDKIKAVAAISKTEDGIPLFVRMKVVTTSKERPCILANVIKLRLPSAPRKSPPPSY